MLQANSISSGKDFPYGRTLGINSCYKPMLNSIKFFQIKVDINPLTIQVAFKKGVQDKDLTRSQFYIQKEYMIRI